MIFTLIGSALGFATSFVPKILDLVQDRMDKKHELAILDRQTTMQVKLGKLGLRQTEILADTERFEAVHRHDSSILNKAAPWTATYSATVRPTVTYFMVFIFVLIKAVAIVVVCVEAWAVYQIVSVSADSLTALINSGDTFLENQGKIWDDPTAAIFAAIISFWFGGREIRRRQGRM